MNRDEALNIIKEHVESGNIVKHMIATEAVMKALAKELRIKNQELSNEEFDEEEWGLVGLLHDGDYCEGVPMEKQGVQIAEWVESKGFELPDNVKHAMAAHNASNTGVVPVSKMDWSIFCCDSLTGLITACALVLPNKKLADVKVESVLKKFKTPSFASGTRREDIKKCEEHLGLSLEEFVTIALVAMQGISDELGL